MLSLRPQDEVSAWHQAEVDIELWRDYEPEARTVPGIALGARRLTGDCRTAAADLFDTGVRYAQLAEPVQLCGDVSASSARALVLIRELTARGIAVRWIARCDTGCADHHDLAHLFPPVWVFGTPNSTSARWRTEFFPSRCVFRHGPDFIEVRDRRFGALRRRIVTNVQVRDAIEDLLDGIPPAHVPEDVVAELTDARLVLMQAGHLWWLPTPVYRWPFPSMTI